MMMICASTVFTPNSVKFKGTLTLKISIINSIATNEVIPPANLGTKTTLGWFPFIN